MLRYIKKCFFTAIRFFSSNLLNVNSLECVSINNQECKIRPEIINLDTNEPLFYPYRIKTNKCKGSCNTINDPYAKICVPGNIKNANVKVFNLISRTNETRHIKCDCECDKSCDIGKYPDYKNCKCRKKIIDKLIEECSENTDENKMLYNETLNIISSSDNNKTCDSCIVYIVFFSVFLITNISMAIYIYFFLYLKNKSSNSHYFGCLNINDY